MLAKSIVFGLSVLAVAGAVAAQGPCARSCMDASAKANGCSDVECYCTRTDYMFDLGLCLKDNCSDAELQEAVDIQQAQCTAYATGGLSITGPSTATGTVASGPAASGTATGTGRGSGSTPTSSSTGSNNSAALPHIGSTNAALAVLALGLVVGGFVL
ncbi:hypothetical protein BDZ94DRAFT_1326016 [Collybia nuda]|uniref:CFEM domain-containing protein n=1 Tax=Collybia nuda TaxID=64659 RepID=A0A9P6C9W5_9AGAR|nr:hypothetical protein BDZ94DRAFT_1326016 [Collybia nuda]